SPGFSYQQSVEKSAHQSRIPHVTRERVNVGIAFFEHGVNVDVGRLDRQRYFVELKGLAQKWIFPTISLHITRCERYYTGEDRKLNKGNLLLLRHDHCSLRRSESVTLRPRFPYVAIPIAIDFPKRSSNPAGFSGDYE